MKQKFDNNYHEKFIKYFGIKEKPGEVEKSFYEKCYKYFKYIKWIPGIKMIGIGNSLAMNSANQESDIDLYIVTSNNSMWLNRILITFIFQVLMVRKNDKKHAGRFCLSFFSTTKGMDFSNWKIENDIYLYFWIIYLKPILNYENTYEKFIEINSSWADFSEYNNFFEENKKYIKYTSPQYYPRVLSLASQFTLYPYRRGSIRKILSNIFNNIIYPFGKFLLGKLNSILKKIFLPKTLKHFEKIGKPYGVIINDDLLKFHNNDIRKKVKEDLDN